MKKVMFILVLGALMACLIPVRAQVTAAQEWQTATLQGSGSNYSAKITPVGANTVTSEATTTSNSPSRIRGRQNDDEWGTNQDGGDTSETGSPVGDAVLPLLLFALASCGVVYLRRKRQA